MKAIFVLAFLAVVVFGQPIPEDERVNGVNGWYIPQYDGSLEWMDKDDAENLLTEYEKLEEESELEGREIISTSPVNYYLYTNDNPSKSDHVSDSTKSFSKSNFNPNNPTRFVIHGWTQSYLSSMNKEIRDAWLSQGNYNIIIVDWARARSLEYVSSVSAVSKTGRKIADFIDWMNQNVGLNFDTLEVIGHSLGAHVSGYAGKNVKRGQIHTIVGLDPALPLFSYTSPTKRLAYTDAFYVESIQTNGGTLGFLQPIGKGAFYPNGGQTQPGCIADITGACSHGRSTSYYAEAVQKNDFPTYKCTTYVDAVNDNCGSTYSTVKMASASNAVVVAGDFYVPVNSKSPYGMGN